jgi:UDP-glucose 4-epimerase
VASWLHRVTSNEPIEVEGDGEQIDDYIYIDDALEATLAAAIRGIPGQAYNVGTGRALSMNRVLATMKKVVGRRPLVARRQAQPWLSRPHLIADSTLARRDLKFAAVVTLEDGLARQHRAILESLAGTLQASHP